MIHRKQMLTGARKLLLIATGLTARYGADKVVLWPD